MKDIFFTSRAQGVIHVNQCNVEFSSMLISPFTKACKYNLVMSLFFIKTSVNFTGSVKLWYILLLCCIWIFTNPLF